MKSCIGRNLACALLIGSASMTFMFTYQRDENTILSERSHVSVEYSRLIVHPRESIVWNDF